MKNETIFEFVNGTSSYSPNKDAQNELESSLSTELSKIINTDIGDDVLDLRMLTVANSLIETDSFSLFDDDHGLDDFLSHVYLMKTRAHFQAFHTLFDFLIKEQNNEKTNAVSLQDETACFAFEHSNPDLKRKVIEKTVVFFDSNLHSIAITAVYKDNNFVEFSSIPINYLSLKYNEKVKLEIYNTKFYHRYFTLQMNKRTGAKMTIQSIDKTKNTLGVINHASSLLGLDFSITNN